MNKSIYEEAIEILLNIGTEFISVPCNPIGEENSDMIHLRDVNETYETNMREVVKALNQAHKQKKLLGHYKDLAEVRKELYELTIDLTINFRQSNKDRMIVLFAQETLVSNIIKELENGN